MPNLIDIVISCKQLLNSCKLSIISSKLEIDLLHDKHTYLLEMYEVNLLLLK